MAVSAVGVCNQALSSLGQAATAIESFDERSVAARQCSLWYDQARQEVLEAHDWSFARRRQTLAPHSDDPPDQWAYRYQVPSGILKARLIWNPAGLDADQIPFDIEASVNGDVSTIVTDLSPAVLIYTTDVSLVSLFSPMFLGALRHYLASLLAIPLTGKRSTQEDQLKLYQRMLNSAAAMDANQTKLAPPRDAEWVRARA